jgi:hypothetical protein
MQLRFFVTLDIDDDYFNDLEYNNTLQYIKDSVKEIADEFDGAVIDIEIK